MLQQSKFKIIIILLIVFSSFNPNIVKAKNTVNIYFFHSNTCSHCQNERKVLDKLEKKYDNIKIYSYEVHKDNNSEILKEVGKIYNINNITGVPITVIGDTIYTGFNEEKGITIFTKTIEYYSRYGYEDRTGNYLNITTNNLYPVKDNNISLKEFINNYNNYKLLFNIYSDDISIDNLGILIGLILGINPILLLGIFILIYKYKKDIIKTIKYSILYIVTCIILTTIYNILNINYINIAVMLLLDILYVITRKKIKLNDYIFILLLSSITSALNTYIYPKYISIFSNILSLNNLSIIKIILYYIELYIIYIFIPLFILVITTYKINKKRQSN